MFSGPPTSRSARIYKGFTDKKLKIAPIYRDPHACTDKMYYVSPPASLHLSLIQLAFKNQNSKLKNDTTARMRTDTARILLKSGMQKRPLFDSFRSADLEISPYLQGV